MSRLRCYAPKENESCFQLHNWFCMNMARCYRRDEYASRGGVKIKADSPRGKHGGYRPTAPDPCPEEGCPLDGSAHDGCPCIGEDDTLK